MSWWLLPVVLLYSIFQLVLGIAIGMWLKDRRMSATRVSEEHNRELLARLNYLAATMAVDVGQHSTRIEEISSTLKPVVDADVATEPGAAPKIPAADDTVLLETIEQIVSANEHLCTKLATAEQQLHEQAEQISFHLAEARIDAVTELPNRRHFDFEISRRFTEWQRTANPFSLAMLDIDHFKQINDRYGHQAGDKILHDVAQRLMSTMREMDVVARYGGEEFAILLGCTSFEDAKCAAERARQAIDAAPFEYDDKKIRVTVSVGVSDVACCDSAATMIKRADAGLYAAKESGRNSSFANDGRSCSRVKMQERKALPSRMQTSPEVAGEDALAAGATVDALTDWVTGFPNRRAFSDQLRTRITQAHERHSPLALVVVAIDGFAECASLHGQDVVDSSLRTVADTIRSAARKGDVVTRYGWDGFAVILSAADSTAARSIATAISAALGALPEKHGSMAGIQLKLGLATLKPADDVVTLAKRADAAVQTCTPSGQIAELVG